MGLKILKKDDLEKSGRLFIERSLEKNSSVSIITLDLQNIDNPSRGSFFTIKRVTNSKQQDIKTIDDTVAHIEADIKDKHQDVLAAQGQIDVEKLLDLLN